MVINIDMRLKKSSTLCFAAPESNFWISNIKDEVTIDLWIVHWSVRWDFWIHFITNFYGFSRPRCIQNFNSRVVLDKNVPEVEFSNWREFALVKISIEDRSHATGCRSDQDLWEKMDLWSFEPIYGDIGITNWFSFWMVENRTLRDTSHDSIIFSTI